MGIVDDNDCVEYHGYKYQELVGRYGEVHWLIWCIYGNGRKARVKDLNPRDVNKCTHVTRKLQSSFWGFTKK